MAKEIKIKVENRFAIEKRAMNVYHHYDRSTHLISYGSSVELPLKPAGENDFLHISIVAGPGPLEGPCIVNLPHWIDFQFSPGGEVDVTHPENRTLLKIPPGPPVWQLKLTRSSSTFFKQTSDRITVGDSQQGSQ